MKWKDCENTTISDLISLALQLVFGKNELSS